MVTMIPDVTPTPQSEQIIFNILKCADQASEWKVFHSIKVENPDDPVWTLEIDFVIFVPKYCSVICLEAKAGSFTIKQNQWYARYKTKPLKISPPDQAERAMDALKEQFETYFAAPSFYLGCAVAFTDTKEPSSSLTYLAKLIWADDALYPDKLSQKIEEHAKALSNGIQVTPAQQEKFANLQDQLENNVTLKPIKRPEKITRSDLDALRPHLFCLRSDQLNSLKIVKLNDRCVIDGAAGTGKTVLATELAKQRCEEGETVALLCSNPKLSDHLDKCAKTLSTDSYGRVVAGTPATLPEWAFRENRELKAKHHRRLNASKLEESPRFRYLDSQWKQFIDETVEDLKQEGEGVFDYLIVDEAQNMCDEVFLKLMDALLKDGLADGRWTMFGDFANQNIVSPDFDKKGTDVLKDFGLNWTNDMLETNCRNTHEIASIVAKFVDIDSPPISGVHGPLIQHEYFIDDELESMLDCLVDSVRKRKFTSQQIILLSSDADKEFGKSTYGGWTLQNIGPQKKKEQKGNRIKYPTVPSGPDKTLRYSNVYDFHGLESEVVILVLPVTNRQTILGGSVTLPDFEHLRRILYIGMSRAKAMLIIVADESYKRTLRLRQNIRRPPSHR